jgi:hypothetical protein
MTAETAQASTVHHPLGKPGGPGLFRMKGAQLPAYIQNVAKHMDGPLSRKIQMAIGIVRNWAQGHDGHGNRVSADVQAAAVKAIAEYDALRAAAKAKPNQGSDNAGEHDVVIDLDWSKWDAAHKGQSIPQQAASIVKAGLASIHSTPVTQAMIDKANRDVANAKTAKKAAAARKKVLALRKRQVVKAQKAAAKKPKAKPIKKSVPKPVVKKAKKVKVKKVKVKKAVAAKKAPVAKKTIPLYGPKKALHLSDSDKQRVIDLVMAHGHKQNMTKGELGSHLQNQHSIRYDNGATRAQMATMHSQCHQGVVGKV